MCLAELAYGSEAAVKQSAQQVARPERKSS